MRSSFFSAVIFASSISSEIPIERLITTDDKECFIGNPAFRNLEVNFTLRLFPKKLKGALIYAIQKLARITNDGKRRFDIVGCHCQVKSGVG